MRTNIVITYLSFISIFMVSIVPQVEKNGRYELQAAANALGVNKATLLRYTHQGKIKAGIKRANRRRYWTGAELIRFWMAEY